MLLTIPIGIILLVLLILASIIFDIKDFSKKDSFEQKDNSLAKKIAIITVC